MKEEMDRPSLLVIVRHSQSKRNRAKKNNAYLPDDASADVIRGIPDHEIPLTDVGWRQGFAVGPHIREEFGIFDAVYNSGYLRTIQTQEAVMSAYTPNERARMKFRVNDFIRERRSGYTYDMTTKQAQAAFPWLQQHWEMNGPFHAVPPGGESQSDVCRNTFLFIGLLMKIRAGKKVLLFTHGGTIRALRYNLERWTPEEYMRRYKEGAAPENCGVTAYRYSEETGRLELEYYNRVHWDEALLLD